MKEEEFHDTIELETGDYVCTVNTKHKKITYIDKIPADNTYDSPEHKTADVVRIQDKKIEFTFSFRTSLITGSKVINIFKNGKYNGTIRDYEYIKTNLGPRMDEYFIPTKRNLEIPFSEKEKWLIDIFDKYQHTEKLVRILFNIDEITIEEFIEKFEIGIRKAHKYLHTLEKIGLLKSYRKTGKKNKPIKVYKLGIDKKVIQYIIKKFYNIE